MPRIPKTVGRRARTYDGLWSDVKKILRAIPSDPVGAGSRLRGSRRLRETAKSRRRQDAAWKERDGDG